MDRLLIENKRQPTATILVSILLMVSLQPLKVNAQENDALNLHCDAIVFDGHNDLPTRILDFGFDIGMNGDEPTDRSSFLYEGIPWLPFPPYGDNVKTDTDLTRISEGGLDAQFFAIFVGDHFYDHVDPTSGKSQQRALDMIEALQEQINKHSDEMEMAYTSQDVERIVSAGKLASLMGLEGGHAIEDDLENLRSFYELGIRYMTLTWSFSHTWADSSGDIDDSKVDHHGGLSEFGREVVKEMNRLGMIVDVSHAADETFWDVLEISSAPIIASHSNCRALADSSRNLSDEMIRAVGSNGGVVMINFVIFYLDNRKTTPGKFFANWLKNPFNLDTTVSHIADHIDHVVQVAGIDYVGLGSDFDGGASTPEDMQDLADLPNITAELVSRGYSDEDIFKILGGNILRVMAEVESIAESDNGTDDERS